MVALEPAAIVLVRFPFSDLSAPKLRPAVVLARSGGVDWILGQVTSNPYGDSAAVGMTSFASGGLGRESFARPGKLEAAQAHWRCDFGAVAAMVPIPPPDDALPLTQEP